MKASDPLIVLATHFALLSLFAIGGANAAIPEMYRIAVHVEGWLTEQQFSDLFAIAQFRMVDRYHALGIDPRELFRRADRLLFGLSRKLGNVPGTDRPYLLAPDPDAPGYEEHLEFVLPGDGQRSIGARAMMRAIDLGARLLPS